MKRYPSYKPSGVDWLGEVPANWEVWKVSRLFKKIGSGTTPKAGNPEYYENGIIPWVNTGDLNDGYIDNCSNYITQKAFDDHSTLKIYEAGTLLVAMYGATIGKTAITKFAACTNQACCSLVSSKLIDTKFAFYWFLANKENIINLSYGGGQPNISQDVVRSLKIPISNIPEQLSIVRFLDYKTSQIDAFIANRHKQIELLKEQKAGIINKAVTKGINPIAKMKESGIEWIGEVPEHWEIWTIAKLAKKLCNGFVGPTNDILVASGIRYLQSLHIKGNQIKFNKPFYVNEKWSQEHSRSILKTGDVLIVQTGDIGQVACVSKEFEGCNCHALIIVQVKKKMAYGEYISTLLSSNFGVSELKSVQTGTVLPHLNSGTIKYIKLTVPPQNEQLEILEYLKMETGIIETLISKYQKQIDLMQEYRTSLISQAVTGKIDVRDWQPKTKEYKTDQQPVQMAAEK